MEHTTCETPGHELRPGPYIIEGRRACRSCRNKHVRESDPDYVKKNPGPKPDPSRPNSRYNETSRHYGDRESARRPVGRPRGDDYENSWRARGPVQCNNGHKWVEGSYKVRSDGKKICLVCIEERKGEMCPAGRHLRSEHQNEFGACRPCATERQPIYRLKAKYGLTLEQFEAMLAEQDNRCAVCGGEFDFESHNGVCVDHNHACCSGQTTCGKCVRGILCGDCNQGLGRFKDSPDIMRAAIFYVDRWQLPQG